MNKSKLLVLLLSLIATPVLGADDDLNIWCGITKHPNEVPLWREQTMSYQSGNSLYDICTKRAGDPLATSPASPTCFRHRT
jgi:hypothetical protein